MVKQYYLTHKWYSYMYDPSGQSEPGSNGKVGYATFLKVPVLEPHHWKQFSVICRTLVGGGSYPSVEV